MAEGAKEDAASWQNFLRSLKERGLKGVRLIVSDKCLGLVEASGEFFPEAVWQRCVVHFYRNVMTAVPTDKVKQVMAATKAIHAQEDRQAAVEKAVALKLEGMKLRKATEIRVVMRRQVAGDNSEQVYEARAAEKCSAESGVHLLRGRPGDTGGHGAKWLPQCHDRQLHYVYGIRTDGWRHARTVELLLPVPP